MNSPMKTSKRIALVTGAEMAKADTESHWLVAELAALGIVGELVPWQAQIDWAAYPLVVVRTPWDYFRYRDDFLAWAARVAGQTALMNPPAVLAWNSHKAYLRELAAAGVATVPTHWLAAGAADEGVLSTCGWPQVVIKPAVSIGAIGAWCGAAAAGAALAHLRSLLAEGDVLVQPYLPSIADEGEISLIYFAGEFSHAVCKRPQAGDFRVQDMYGGSVAAVVADAAAQSLASRALALAPGDLLYARVDLVRHAGQWAVMELELIEPELFLPRDPAAARRFATAIAARLAV